MPMQNNDDKISLVIAGRSHSDWSSYRIDSDFLKAADGWQLQLGLPEKVFLADIVRVRRSVCRWETRRSSVVAWTACAAVYPVRAAR